MRTVKVRCSPSQCHAYCRAFPFTHHRPEVGEKAFDVRPAQVGRAGMPLHRAERSLVPAQLHMIAVFAIIFNAIETP
jgi:hypothetical protein